MSDEYIGGLADVSGPLDILSLATMWWGTWLRDFQLETAWGVVERTLAISAREVTPRESIRDSNSLKFIR